MTTMMMMTEMSSSACAKTKTRVLARPITIAPHDSIAICISKLDSLRLRFANHHIPTLLQLPTHAPLDKLIPGCISGPLDERFISIQITPTHALQRMKPDTFNSKLHDCALVAIHRTPRPPKAHPIIMHKRPEHNANFAVPMLEFLLHSDRFAELVLPTREVQDAVADELLHFWEGKRRPRMNIVEKVLQRGLVRFPVFGQDGGVDDEHVRALGEVVAPSGAQDAFAEFAHREEDVGYVVWPLGAGSAMGERRAPVFAAVVFGVGRCMATEG